MPAVRMKAKSSMGCLKEKNGLRVCRHSSSICKSSCSHVKISPLASESGTCTEDCHDVTSGDESATGGVESLKPSDDKQLLCGENIGSTMEPMSSDVSSAREGMESMADACSSDCEMIFSPTASEAEIHEEANVCGNEGCNNNSEPDHCNTTDESDGTGGSSCDNGTCNVSDFYISDMALTGLPLYGGTFPGDFIERNPFLEFDIARSDMFFDDSEQFIALPFLDDLVESSDLHSAQICEAETDFNDTSLLQAIHQMSPSEQSSDLDPSSDSDQADCFDPYSFIRNLPDLSDVMSTCRPAILPKESRERKPITLVLDLDETLVHSSLEHCEDADFTFKVFFNMKDHTVYVKKRPHLQSFLEKVAEMFEVVVFTASQSIYAEQLLDILDPHGKFFCGRAYRESCIFADGTYTKDLTVLGLDLAKVFIIDNCPQVFRWHVNNGIPIKSWFDDPSDSELISLIPFLETLVDAVDVRPIIAKRFGNKE